MDVKFYCPQCHQHLEAPDSMSGEVVECPSCFSSITVPYSRLPAHLTEKSDFTRNTSFSDDFYESQGNAEARLKKIMSDLPRQTVRSGANHERWQMVGYFLLGIFFIFLLIVFSPSSGCDWVYRNGGSRSSSEEYTGWSKIKEKTIGWKNTSDFAKSRDLVVSGDKTAWHKHYTQCLLAGTAIIFDAGTKVYVEDRAIFAERVLVRMEGSTDSYWVISQDVK